MVQELQEYLPCPKHDRDCNVVFRSDHRDHHNRQSIPDRPQSGLLRISEEKQRCGNDTEKTNGIQTDSIETLQDVRALERQRRKEFSSTDNHTDDRAVSKPLALEKLVMKDLQRTPTIDATARYLDTHLSRSTLALLADVPAGFWEPDLDPKMLESYLAPAPS